MSEKHALQICVQIPFCPAGSLPKGYTALEPDADTVHAYALALLREIRAAAADFQDSVVESICFTGGSPTCLSPQDFIAISRAIRENYQVAEDAELTAAVLPNRVEARWMVHFQHVGITRLSLNLITCHSRDAKACGIPATIGSMETALVLPQLYHLKSYEAALSYGLPGQTLQSFRTSLRFAIRYHAPEITLTDASAHLTAEETSSLTSTASESAAPVSDMLSYAAEHLTEKGYEEYLPGHWALPGHKCRQLLATHAGSDYLSFGIGTGSRTDGVYYKTTNQLSTYLRYAEEPERIYTVVSVQES